MAHKRKAFSNKVEKTVVSEEDYRKFANQNGEFLEFPHTRIFGVGKKTGLYLYSPEKIARTGIEPFALRLVGEEEDMRGYLDFYLSLNTKIKSEVRYTGRSLGLSAKELAYRFPKIEETEETEKRRRNTKHGRAIMRYAFLKKEAAPEARRILSGKHHDGTLVDKVLRYGEFAREARERVVESSTGLIYRVFDCMGLSKQDKSELLTDGLIILDRCVRRFNPNMGWQFSTYACRALFQNINNTQRKEALYYARFPTAIFYQLDKEENTSSRFDKEEIAQIREVVKRNLANLKEQELAVISGRFLSGDVVVTLEEVGKKIGVTKERVRQIQNKALKELRKYLEKSSRCNTLNQ